MKCWSAFVINAFHQPVTKFSFNILIFFESRGINLYGSMFKWKYPLWYSKNIVAEDCHWFEMARAGVWYTDNIAVRRALIQAPKNFRRCKGLELTDVTFTHAEETLWSCDDVTIDHVTAKGDYFAAGSSDNQQRRRLPLLWETTAFCCVY